LDFEFVKGLNEKEILHNAKAIEDLSEHPLSFAVSDYALNKIGKESIKNIEVTDFLNIEGKGVVAKIHGKEVIMGNLALIQSKNISNDKTILDKAERFMMQGTSVVFYAYNGELQAVFSIADSIKADTKSSLQKLHKLGVKLIMLTGDNFQTANSIAKNLNMDEVISEVLPKEKALKIKELKTADPSNIIAMVGDGINDAPALAQADIGIAMGTGTDIAIESADIIIIKGSLEKLVESIALSKHTIRIIKQNMLWAFGYNIIAIPIIASAAMAFSSISVVSNSTRLQRVRLTFN
jgi:Cu+-exporting ATPase